ncbi:DUF4402 domain-containing protein [Marinomonas gallaica]|uniref:DUF4402 domain-containing protein n=1 Tax=Marinomonas gallaica TaxID=1806667 RepID=UPI000833A243|nr:DUF4402 domain-containing protein [Marinomonas gallaica]
MKKIFKYLPIVALPAIGMSSAFALEQVNGSATVIVQNSFTLQEDSGLDFGTVRASADTTGTTVATLTLPADGSASSVVQGTNATIQEITPGAAATFSISGAAPSTALTLTLPTSTTLTTGGGTASFTVNNFIAEVTSGPSNGSTYAASNLITDTAGAVTFSVGADLVTDDGTPSADYLNGTYTGTYQVSVDY